MGKNLKKVLSYTLGIFLALGLGLSYAYAVGANDSNAFVTKQEWEEKVTQLRTSIDNISKTINDTTMDYMINGPRLRVSFFDGYRNTAPTGSAGQMTFDTPFSYNSTTSVYNTYPRYNNIVLMDKWNGQQGIDNFYWHTSDLANHQLNCSARFAIKTITPNDYVIVSVFDGSGRNIYCITFQHVVVGDLTEYPYTNQRELKISLPLDKWWTLTGTAGPETRSRETANMYYATGSNNKNNATMMRGNADSNWPAGGAITCSVGVAEVSFILEFPAGAHTIKQQTLSSPYCLWNVFPMNLENITLGGVYDYVYVPSSASDLNNPVVKVYSPQKGCLCLKNYLNGEVPILNE